MKNYFYLTAFLLFLMNPVFGDSIPLVTVNSDDKRIMVMNQADVLLDENSEYKIENLVNQTNYGWKILNQESPNFGYVNHSVWVRFLLDFQEDSDKFILRFNYPTTDLIELYLLDKNSKKIIYKWKGGDIHPFENRFLPSHSFHFPFSNIPLPNDSFLVYMKFQTTASLIIPLEIVSLDEFYKIETNIYIFFGLYFGFLISIFIYNFILYLFTKEKLFYFYLFFLASYFFMVFSGYGFGTRYLYSDSVYWKNHFFLISAGINSLASTLFSVIFLRLRIDFPKTTIFLYGIMIFTFLWTVAFAWTGEQFFYKMVAISNFTPLLVVLVLSVILFPRYVYARYFFFGWFIYIIFYFLAVFRLVGLVPNVPLTYYGIQFGSAFEMLILSVAIGHRLYEYKKKSDELSQEILNQKSKLNDQLTQLVEEKTQTLQATVTAIQKDIEVARDIQLSTIPQKIDWTKDGLDVAAFFFPKDRVSGDIYDLCQLDEDRYRIFLADATGHGIQAGFFTMSIKTEYERIKYEFSDTSQVLRILNQSIFKTFGESLMLYSCFILDIDLSQRYFQYSSAGHPEQLLYQNGNLVEMGSLGPILGFKKDPIIKSKSIPMYTPFRIFLYSDGITEVRNKNMEEFGLEKIKEKIISTDNPKADRFLFDVFLESNEFSIDIGFVDDVTMIYIRSMD